MDSLYRNKLQLFADSEGKPMITDLGAANINRGREVGLPPYFKWRELATNEKTRTFIDLSQQIGVERTRLLRTVYKSARDIDLFVGMIFENPEGPGFAGPTLQYLFDEQMTRLKIGDRFWYENGPSPIAFTLGKINSVNS